MKNGVSDCQKKKYQEQNAHTKNMELQEFSSVVLIPIWHILNLEKAPGNCVKTPPQTKEAQRQQPEEKQRQVARKSVASCNIHWQTR